MTNFTYVTQKAYQITPRAPRTLPVI